jgi:hypothetical protein
MKVAETARWKQANIIKIFVVKQRRIRSQLNYASVPSVVVYLLLANVQQLQIQKAFTSLCSLVTLVSSHDTNVAKFIVPATGEGDKVDSDIGLSYRPATRPPAYIHTPAGGTTTLCRSQLHISPSQEL